MSSKIYRPMRALFLAGVLSIAAITAAHASDGPGDPTDNTSRSHASAAPNCEATGSVQKKGEDRLFGDRCRVIAGDGGPTGAGENNGRSAELNTWHPMLAGGGVRGGDISF